MPVRFLFAFLAMFLVFSCQKPSEGTVDVEATIDQEISPTFADEHINVGKLAGSYLSAGENTPIILMAADPAKLAGEAKQKTLIIQGKNDIQVDVPDAELIHEQTGGTLVLLDEVNHVLKIAPMDRAGNIATYRNSDLPVADSVINAITEFVNQ